MVQPMKSHEHEQAYTARDMMPASGGRAATAMAARSNRTWADEVSPADGPAATKGNINHSVCLWCYKGSKVEKVEDMAPVAKKLGLKGIDLLEPKQFGPLKENGLICSMTSGVKGGITKGLNRKEIGRASC